MLVCQAINKSRSLLWGKGGSVAISFGLVVAPLVVAMGMSTDFMRAYSAKVRLQSALDAAALAVGASNPNATTVTTAMSAEAAKYFSANFPNANGITASPPSVAISGQTVTLSATATVPTSFLQVAGVETIDIGANSTAMRYLSGVEVVMALDNTGSMGLSNINTLKLASYSLLGQLFGTTSSGTLNPSSATVKVGLVPYVASVNAIPAVSADVTASARNTIIDKLIGTSYGSGAAANPLAYDPADPTKWTGCVVEDTSTTFAAVASASSTYSSYSASSLNIAALETALNKTSTNGTAIQYVRPPDLWNTKTSPKSCVIASSWPFTNGGGAAGTTIPDATCANSYAWPPSTTTGVKTASKWYGANDDGSNGGQGSDYGPNQSCPATPVVPLTGNSAQLVAELGITVSGGTVSANDSAGLLDWHQGGTTGSLGLAWAYRALEPSSNAGLYSSVSTSRDWNTPGWQKALVLMTDGANTFFSTQYTGYGPYQTNYSKYNTTGSTSYGTYSFSNVSYNKMLEMQEMAVCDALKSHGVTIYTLFFNDGSSPGPAIGYCGGPSSTVGHPAKVNGSTFDYSNFTFYAADPSDLTAAFTKIGNQLSKLRIVK